MTITLTTPEQRPDATVAKLVSFTVNAETRYAEAGFIIGFGDPFTTTRRQTLVFQDSPEGPGAGKSDIADFSFQQLIDNVIEVRDLRQALETAVIAFAVFDGIVT